MLLNSVAPAQLLRTCIALSVAACAETIAHGTEQMRVNRVSERIECMLRVYLCDQSLSSRCAAWVLVLMCVPCSEDTLEPSRTKQSRTPLCAFEEARNEPPLTRTLRKLRGFPS